MLSLLLNEDVWFFFAAGSASSAAVVWALRHRRESIARRSKAAVGLCLFLGVFIGIEGTGHLLAVSTKAILGTLPRDSSLYALIPFGIGLAVPGWWLAALAPILVTGRAKPRATATALSVWLALLLVVPGWPLALLAAITVVTVRGLEAS